MNVISLGAGVQSTTLLLMAVHGEITPKPEYAIFSDTGWEPTKVYKHLELLRMIAKKAGIKVITTRRDRMLSRQEDIREDTREGKYTGERFASMPFFVLDEETGKKGIVHRQCTREYKIEPIRREIRRLLGYKPRQKVKEEVIMWLGISLDEVERMRHSDVKWVKNRYPLIEMEMDRMDCIAWLKKHSYPVPPKSACIGCPFHDDLYWLDMKRNNPSEWMEAVYFDRMIRDLPRLKGQAFLHRSCKPLDEVNLGENQGELNLFLNECEGMCGV